MNRNVSDGLYSAPTTPEQEVPTWTAEELNTSLTFASTDELFPFWRLAAMTGARRGELLGLRWRDVDVTAGTITVSKGRVNGFHGHVESGRPKSARSPRTIEIDAATVASLTELRRRQDIVFDRRARVPLRGRVTTPPGRCESPVRHARP